MEDIEFLLDHSKEQMDKAISHAIQSLAKIRAGKATPSMVEGVMIDYYGNATPLTQVASITSPDARTISIKPWEKSVISDIERAIINSDLGLNPQSDGELVRINIPPLTEERRLALVKQAKSEAENGKISIRNIRKDTNDSLRKLLKDNVSEDLVKDAEAEVQILTDQHVRKIDELFAVKEKDIMTI
ncbi:MAG: ribosome recycling factor [Cyclobacteriaceae bacterium]|jgi:ribosome recycling factor